MNELEEIKTADSLADETAETQTNDSPAEEAETSEAEENLEKTGELPEDSEEHTSAEESEENDAPDEDKTESEDKTSEEDSEEKKPRSLLSKIANSVLVAVLVLITAFTAYIMINAHHGKAVSIFGNYVLRVTTGSMEPSLHIGDYILIEKPDIGSLKEGDIISFYSESPDVYGMLVTHRIESVEPDGSFITKGDANPVEDSVSVRSDRIVGKYIRKARFFRWAGSFGDRRKLLLLFVMIPTACAAVYEVRTMARLKVRIDEEKQKQSEAHERLIREAIEKEKARLAAEGFGTDKNKADEKPAENGSEDEAVTAEKDPDKEE